MTDHPCKGLSKAARKAFEAISINQPPRCAQKTLDLLLERGLIERAPDRIVAQSALGPIVVKDYRVPLPVHYQFCTWASEQPGMDDL